MKKEFTCGMCGSKYHERSDLYTMSLDEWVFVKRLEGLKEDIKCDLKCVGGVPDEDIESTIRYIMISIRSRLGELGPHYKK